jgi:PPOX class probable F420-dependent enzyme
VDPDLARQRVRDARVGRLATRTRAGWPHVVVCCFALLGDTAYSVVDRKPKSTRALRRLDNVRADPAAALLVDHYDDEDWSALWGVRADGSAREVAQHPERRRAIDALRAKYPQYRDGDLELRGDEPMLAVDLARWRSWAAQ